jgi:methyl-accepting chemotaxis protein
MGEIARKINAINDIAFQINILALNAAVEAARAGIYGKGFGVVADEVGKLADRSKLAALEIDQLTARSYIVAKESGISLEKIAPEIQKTAVLVQDIVNASIEQNAGSDQINSAIQQLNNVTQQNASSAEQLASSVENLHLLAEKLNKLIAFFKIGKNEIEKSKEKKQIEKLEKYKEEMAVERGKKNKITIDKDAEISEEKINGPQNLSDKGYNLDLRNEKSFDDGFEKF